VNTTPQLEDGEYPAFVIDVDDTADGSRTLELTILSGEHKGEVVTITAVGLAGDYVDLIGMPATIVVADGRPSVTIDS